MWHVAGENWQNESYNGEDGWQLPASWQEEVPTTGILTLTYVMATVAVTAVGGVLMLIVLCNLLSSPPLPP